ncbi:TIGR04338 family metallohydrolase [Gordonia sp. VNK21]|uniref:TIGR04338 family metallohydrolase n=1 Tax=Gordonia sp. VNK21 TaxID=3382483 RepID=UPI0038D4D684
MTRDAARSRFYATERLVLDLVERAGPAHTVQLAGTTLTLPVEARFGSVEDIQEYADRVLALPSVREHFPRAQIPITVRRRRSGAAAHYSPGSAEIAVPDDRDGRWALRELVVLHELAHHLDDGDGPAHGRAYANTLIDLVGLVLGPELALVYRVLLGDAGLL